jgi:isopenicillin N synthase-like dioxygenase
MVPFAGTLRLWHGHGPTRRNSRIIPVLDVSRYFAGDIHEPPRLGCELRNAYENVGFYYLRGHGVPRSLIAATFAECERFHAQPMERKLALRINEHNIGYMAMGGPSRAVRRSTTTRSQA